MLDGDSHYICLYLPDDAALVLVVPLHVEVAVVCDGKYVWRHLTNLLVGVEADVVWSVDGQQLVGINCNQDRTCVSLKEPKNREADVSNCEGTMQQLAGFYFRFL